MRILGCSHIKAMLRNLPLGKRRIESGLMLREAILINGVLLNTESWHGVTGVHIAKLQIVDNALSREITKSHSKVAREFLHLETGILPLFQVMSSRRIHYLWYIIDRNDNELIKRIYIKQNKSPVKGDWINLIKSDLEMFDPNLDKAKLSAIKKIRIKKKIKTTHI